MTKTQIILLALTIISMAFKSDKKEIEFTYPKNKQASFLMTTDLFTKFQKEWRGADYYYMSEKGDNGFVCSVLFYKLNKDEEQMLVDMPRQLLGGPEVSPLYPLTYFSTNSNLKAFESNQIKWGDPSDDFMFSHADIKEFNGIKMNQKHMYGFAMFGKDLFVNIHLSKVGCTPEDSTAMKQLLDGLRKKK
jgi:YHS domain-containing protein